jgi:hypothetical protein
VRRRWQIAGQLSQLFVEIGGDPNTGGAADDDDGQLESERQLCALLRQARISPRSEAERAVVEIYLHIFGAMPPDWDWAREDPGRRTQLFDRLEGPMVRALRGGMLRVRDDRARAVVVTLPGAAEILGPQSTPTVSDWIRVLVFDGYGQPITASFPSVTSYDLNVTSGPMPGLSFGQDIEIPPGAASACSLILPTLATCADPVPAEAPSPSVIDLRSQRTPVLDVVALSRRELAQTQSASLDSTNVFQLRLRDADVFEFEHFNDGSALFLPAAPPTSVQMQPDAPVVQGTDVLRACLESANAVDLGRVMITGHGDSLSQERAQNVLAVLLGDAGRNVWVALAQSNSVDDDQAALLTWASQKFGWPCDPDAQDPSAGDPRQQALKAFQAGYNADLNEGLFPVDPGGPVRTPLKVDGFIGPHTWGAVFDCYMRTLRPVPPGSLPDGAQQPYLIVDDHHQTYPAKLAGIAAPYPTDDEREQHWTDLNPLNPSRVIPNGGGWYPIQVGDVIYLPTDWNLDALTAQDYEVVVPPPSPPPLPPADGGPPSLPAPGPVVFDCAATHETSPFAQADDRRAVERHVEVLIVQDGLPLPSVGDGTGPCTATTCELYDPRQVSLGYEPLGRIYDVLFDPFINSTDGTESYRLSTSDGAYDQTLSRGDAHLHGGRLRLRFTDLVPSSDYTLTQVIAPGLEIPLLSGMSLGS